MGLFSFLRSFATNNKHVDATLSGQWVSLHGGNEGVDERNLLAANREWVYIATDKVASAVSAVRFKVMRYDRSDEEEIFNGPLVDFLNNPGPGYTGKDFLYLNTVYKELVGNAFWERDGKKIHPMLPTAMRPRLDDQHRLIGYKYSVAGKVRDFQLEDILHDRYIDPARPYWGVGRLSKIAPWADTSTFAVEFLRRFFLNGAQFGGFISTEEETEERIKIIKAGLQNDHVGVANSHKWGVLPKGSKAERMTGNMSEIEMGATDDRYRDKILAAFGVPKNILGLTQGENRATVEGTEYTFAKYTIKPIVDDLIDFLNVYVAPTLDSSGRTYFDYDDFIPKNMDIEIRAREIALGRQQYKTINEARAEEGLPPVDGGDTIYTPPFQQPLGSPQAAPEPRKLPKRSLRAIPGHVRKAVEREERNESTADRLARKMKEMETQRDLDEAAHKDFVGRVESYLDRVSNAVRLFNSEQKRRVVGELSRITKAVSKSELFDADAEVLAMINFVEPVLRGLMTEQALAEYEAQGFEGTFDSGDEMLAKVTARETKRLAKAYNATTAKLLQRALNEGIKNGDGLAELTERVAEVYEFSDTSRAQAVAHTESFHIANQGSLEAYRQSGVVTSQRWYTAEDELVCPWCEPQNGTIIGLSENYFNKGDTVVGSDGKVLHLDYRGISAPPLHTNCRCFIRPETIEID